MTLVFVPFTKVTLRGGEETAWAANTRQSVHAPNGYLLLCISACISAVILATYVYMGSSAATSQRVLLHFTTKVPLQCAKVWGHKIHIHTCSSRVTCIQMVYRAFCN